MISKTEKISKLVKDCSMVESYPVAAIMSKLGYPVFVLNYRTSKGQGEALRPSPVEDLAQAVKYIFSEKKKFGIGTFEQKGCDA